MFYNIYILFVCKYKYFLNIMLIKCIYDKNNLIKNIITLEPLLRYFVNPKNILISSFI